MERFQGCLSGHSRLQTPAEPLAHQAVTIGQLNAICVPGSQTFMQHICISLLFMFAERRGCLGKCRQMMGQPAGAFCQKQSFSPKDQCRNDALRFPLTYAVVEDIMSPVAFFVWLASVCARSLVPTTLVMSISRWHQKNDCEPRFSLPIVYIPFCFSFFEVLMFIAHRPSACLILDNLVVTVVRL